MSKCDVYMNNGPQGKYFRRPVDTECVLCQDECQGDPTDDPCICPPLGEPDKLRIIAPVIFDECGINLCKSVQREVLSQYDDAASVALRVIDINFNISCGEHGSSVEFIEDRPNCVRVHLSNICVKLAVKVLDSMCNIIDTFCMDELYLPDESDPEFDEETNPSFICIDLYAPYGVSYFDNCEECTPTINFLGFIEDGEGYRNNDLRQGIDSQALAKAVKFNPDRGHLAIGLTIYIKVVYFIQYKIPHDGLAVPPKCDPCVDDPGNDCRDFVEGDLLEQNILPLPLFSPAVEDSI